MAYVPIIMHTHRQWFTHFIAKGKITFKARRGLCSLLIDVSVDMIEGIKEAERPRSGKKEYSIPVSGED